MILPVCQYPEISQSDGSWRSQTIDQVQIVFRHLSLLGRLRQSQTTNGSLPKACNNMVMLSKLLHIAILCQGTAI